ncbi:hypothetical protein AB0E88_12695 [Streptomyces sp. NPDC028635]|uniref:nucleotidyltransferase domain-containing protein n=1 Tax=Streptomyces sp. NPDC028635 TaxID=3154800 RepID=UPI0033C6CD77
MTPPSGATRAMRRALGVVRSVGRSVERSPCGFLVDVPGVRQLWSRWAPAADVLVVLDALGRAGVRGWLAGGWGVDALLGRQTRRHSDIDIVLAREDGVEDRVRLALAGVGYRRLDDQVISDGRPLSVRWVLDDGLVAVDLLPVDLARLPFAGLLDGRARTPTPAGDAPTAAAASDPVPDDRGVVAGHVVPCLPLSLQLALHQDYPQRATDRHDLALLKELDTRRRGSP